MVQTLQPPPAKRALREAARNDLPEAMSSIGFPLPLVRLFEDPWGWRDSAERRLFPPLDVAESDAAYMVAVELPGSRKEDVRIQVENGVLTIAGERTFDPRWKDWNLHRVERSYGAFCRSVALPTGVAAEGAKAEMRDGVLVVTFPKSEEAKPRVLKID